MIAAAETDATPINEADAAAPAQPAPSTGEGVMRRRPRVSANAVRERRELDPGTCCPDCGGDLRLVGEDVSEILDMLTAARRSTAKMNGLDPQAYLADVLSRINDHMINRLEELLPWNWAPVAAPCAKAA